ncbi:MAG: hypothetical protein AAGM67_04360 [Bacteroidota bacterium]
MEKQKPESTQEPLTMWTFWIQGGTSFSIEMENGPDLHHQGKTTVWHWFGTSSGAEQLEYRIKDMNGNEGVVLKHNGNQSDSTRLLGQARSGDLSFLTGDFKKEFLS